MKLFKSIIQIINITVIIVLVMKHYGFKIFFFIETLKQLLHSLILLTTSETKFNLSSEHSLEKQRKILI